MTAPTRERPAAAAPQDLRAFIDVLERHGRLRRIAAEVDASWEPATMAKWMFQAIPDADRFGLFFERVRGSSMPLATALIGASVENYALAIGTTPDEINETLRAALHAACAPITVDHAPCQEVRLPVDLGALPIPVWTPGKDPAPYLTTSVITRHAETGGQNYGVYRTQVLGPDRLVINLNPFRQGGRYAATYLDRGRKAPIAFVIGAEPALHVATVANLPYGIDEMEFAGGLLGRPVEMVRATTSELFVPAHAEIVIEGFVLPGETALEGPFGEFAGYMGPVEQKPVIEVTAITTRTAPIYYGLSSQMPPSESTIMQSNTNAGMLYKQLRDDLGEASISDVFIDLTFGGLLAHGIIAMRPLMPGHGERIGRLVAALSPLKRITVVDDDVDIRDPLHLEWAMNARFDPVRDTHILDNVYYQLHMDPAIRPADGRMEKGSKIIIDATQKVDAGIFSLPTREIMEQGLVRWREFGLPAFTIPKRARLRIDRS